MNNNSGKIFINKNTDSEKCVSFQDISSAKEKLTDGLKTILTCLQSNNYTVARSSPNEWSQHLSGGWTDLNMVVEFENSTALLEVGVFQENDESMTLQTFDENYPLSSELIENDMNTDKLISVVLEDFDIVFTSVLIEE